MKYFIILAVLLTSCSCEHEHTQDVKESVNDKGVVYYTIDRNYQAEEVTIKGHLYLKTDVYGPKITLTHAGHCPRTHN
jgi:hypothetical protein